jgi:RNA polymerase sigma factor (sigma-70 family)
MMAVLINPLPVAELPGKALWGPTMPTVIAQMSSSQNSSTRLEGQIESLLKAIVAPHAIKRLFWELLGYDQRTEMVSLLGMAPSLRLHVEKAQLFASHDQFHIYYATLYSDSMARTLVRLIYSHFRRKHRFAALLVGNAAQSEWYLVYQSDEVKSSGAKCRVSMISLGHHDANHRQQSRSLAKLKTYDDDDEDLGLLELTSSYESVFRKNETVSGVASRAKDGVELLLSEIARYPLLNAREERAILEQLDSVSAQVNVCLGKRTKKVRIAVAGRTGEFQDLHRKLIVHNLRLCFYLAKKYAINQDELLDLFQESVLGLHRAIDLVEPSRNLRFSTYAFQWVRQAIMSWIINKRFQIRIPAHFYELPKSERPRLVLLSLDASDSETGFALVDDSLNPASSELDRTEFTKILDECLASLNGRQAAILARRFGLHGSKEQTLEQVGHLYGLTRERIRQLEVKALEKLRSQLKRRLIVKT